MRRVAVAVLTLAAAGAAWGGTRAFDPPDFADPPPARVELGRLLFYDKIISGNRNISCGTCHNHDDASSDALSLGVGEGGRGVGRDRNAGAGRDRITRRVPRNAPALFNLGAAEFTVMFHDGRVAADPTQPSGFDTPAKRYTPMGLDSALAAQALFPVTSSTEMAGAPRENEIATASFERIEWGWREIETRLRLTPGYLPLFKAAYPGEVETADDIDIVRMANAIGAFEATEWRADDSPYDRYLAGDDAALTPAAKRGLALFEGEAGCAECHSGRFQTDQTFHAIAMPQIGPGGTRPYDPTQRDMGRLNVTDSWRDAYCFRTPSLRNVTATAPYGHSGAYATLEDVVRHHLDPVAALRSYDPSQAVLPEAQGLHHPDIGAMADPREVDRIAAANELAPRSLTDAQVADILAFLAALTDEDSLDGRLGKPAAVPSGLPVD